MSWRVTSRNISYEDKCLPLVFKKEGSGEYLSNITSHFFLTSFLLDIIKFQITWRNWEIWHWHFAINVKMHKSNGWHISRKRNTMKHKKQHDVLWVMSLSEITESSLCRTEECSFEALHLSDILPGTIADLMKKPKKKKKNQF